MWVFVSCAVQVALAADPTSEYGAALLDDRRPAAERAAAAAGLADLGGEEVLWILRAAARDRVPEVQIAAMKAAARFEGPEAVGVLSWVLGDGASRKSERSAALVLLAEHGTEEAGAALYAAASDRRVPSFLRVDATEALTLHYPQLLAARGEPRTVVDPFGGGALVLANGLAGGVALSSVGVWGRFEGSEAVGAIGGGAIGVGTGVAYVGARPLTTGQGLAYASGVSWGLALSAWTTSAVHGPWVWIDDRSRGDAVDFGAAYRLVGVTGGAALGAWWMSKDPVGWDVLEVDLAGYLGSAVVLAGAGLLVWDPEPPPWDADEYRTYYDYDYDYDYDYTGTYGDRNDEIAADRAWRRNHLAESKILAGATIGGAAIGLTTGALLRDAWQLDPEDGVYAATLGLEAAWVGNWTPDALGYDDRYSKGTVRLPWNAAIAGGLALAEVHPMSLQTTAVTATTAVSGNLLGAGIPLMIDHNDEQLMAQVMVPVGIVGTVGGNLAAPWLDPGEGEWMMVGVGSGLAAAHGPLVGGALVDYSGFDYDQMGGLTATLAGVTAPSLLAVGHYADPRVDDMLAVGAAAAWGQAFGFATPYALGGEGPVGGLLLATAVTGDVFALGMALALTEPVGLEPRDTLWPQLGGVVGGSVGALGAAMFSAAGEDVALGGVIGSGAGIVGTSLFTATRPSTASNRVSLGVAQPGRWSPLVTADLGPDGRPVSRYGVRITEW